MAKCAEHTLLIKEYDEKFESTNIKIAEVKLELNDKINEHKNDAENHYAAIYTKIDDIKKMMIGVMITIILSFTGVYIPLIIALFQFINK